MLMIPGRERQKRDGRTVLKITWLRKEGVLRWLLKEYLCKKTLGTKLRYVLVCVKYFWLPELI